MSVKFLGQVGAYYHLLDLLGFETHSELQRHYPDLDGTGSNGAFALYERKLQEATYETEEEVFEAMAVALGVQSRLLEKGHPVPGRKFWLCEHDRCSNNRTTGVGSYRPRSAAHAPAQKSR